MGVVLEEISNDGVDFGEGDVVPAYGPVFGTDVTGELLNLGTHDCSSHTGQELYLSWKEG